jgi:pyruvate,orthophosphate dikinase
MQARAIFEAAVEAGKRTGKPVVPEVMVPLIATRAEFDLVKARIDAMAAAVAKESGACYFDTARRSQADGCSLQA